MPAGERAGLHPVPAVPFTAALGATRRVDAMSLVSFEGGCRRGVQLPGEVLAQVSGIRQAGVLGDQIHWQVRGFEQVLG
jgi:hypothetical protein